MNYLEALQDIGGMVNDPNLDTYKARAQLHFIRAINAAIASGDFTEDDYMGYVRVKADVVFTAGVFDLTSYEPVLPVKLSPPPASGDVFGVKMLTKEEVGMISRNPEMSPGYEDVFMWQIGYNLYAQVSSPSAVNLASEEFYMQYVINVDDSGWIDATDLQASANYLSLRLVRAAIGVAVKTLEAEIAGE